MGIPNFVKHALMCGRYFRDDYSRFFNAANDIFKYNAANAFSCVRGFQLESTGFRNLFDHLIVQTEIGFSELHNHERLPALLSLQDRAQAPSLPDNVTQYLESVATLLRAATSVRRMNNSLREFFVRHQNSALKSIVALTDCLFMLDHEGDFTKSSDDLNFYTKEDLAEGASYLIHCFDSEIGIRDAHFNSMAERAIDEAFSTSF